MRSKTKLGAILAGIGAIASIVGSAVQSGGPIPWSEILPQIVAIVGGVVAVIGARDAAKKIESAAKR